MTDAKYGPNSINSEDKYFSFSVSFYHYYLHLFSGISDDSFGFFFDFVLKSLVIAMSFL